MERETPKAQDGKSKNKPLTKAKKTTKKRFFRYK